MIYKFKINTMVKDILKEEEMLIYEKKTTRKIKNY